MCIIVRRLLRGESLKHDVFLRIATHVGQQNNAIIIDNVELCGNCFVNLWLIEIKTQ